MQDDLLIDNIEQILVSLLLNPGWATLDVLPQPLDANWQLYITPRLDENFDLQKFLARVTHTLDI